MDKLIVIGSGPAGWTAGIYAGRSELKPLLFTGEISGGQLMNTSLVENWPGDKDGVMGPDLMIGMRAQAKKFGVKIVDKKVTKVDLKGKVKKVWAGDEVYEARAVIIATGAEAVKLGVPGERELMGRGVAVCAVCDAPFYKDKIAMVVGGGDAAIEDAIALTKFAKKVYIVHRRDKFRASKIMVKRAMENKKIEVLWNTELKEIRGKDKVEKVTLDKDGKTKWVMKVDGVFLAIGHKPATELFKDKLELDEKGYIVTRGKRDGETETSEGGVFAAGDVVDFNYQQAITAAAMGCQAALDAEKYLESL